MNHDSHSPVTRNTLDVIVLNARSVINKMAQLRAIAFEMMPDVICITESWTHPIISDSSLIIDDYDFYRHDRINKRGGGCLLYIRTSFRHFPFYLHSTSFSGNYCFASIIRSPRQKAIIGCVYNPPNSSSEENANLCEMFQFISESTFEVKIIAGDFNFPEIDWLSNYCPPRFQPFLDTIIFSSWS